MKEPHQLNDKICHSQQCCPYTSNHVLIPHHQHCCSQCYMHNSVMASVIWPVYESTGCGWNIAYVDKVSSGIDDSTISQPSCAESGEKAYSPGTSNSRPFLGCFLGRLVAPNVDTSSLVILVLCYWQNHLIPQVLIVKAGLSVRIIRSQRSSYIRCWSL